MRETKKFSRAFVIEECALLLETLKGRVPEDDDGTVRDRIDTVLALAVPHPDVLTRFLAAVRRTAWEIH